MKKSLNMFPVVLILLFNMINSVTGQIGPVTGQDRTDFSLNRKINLNGESEVQKIVLPVSEENNRLTLKIKSTINEGDLTIEVYDPEGEKQGNFSIGCLYSTQSKKGSSDPFKSNSETVNGQILRTYTDPLIGDWIIKIIPKNSSGFLTIESSLTTRGNAEWQTGQRFFQTPFWPIEAFIDSIQTSISENHPYKVTSTYTGTITDIDNKPIRGAKIQVKGMNIGTLSDNNGNFTLITPTFFARTLRFSYPGMKNQDVIVGDRTKFIIMLRPE